MSPQSFVAAGFGDQFIARDYRPARRAEPVDDHVGHQIGDETVNPTVELGPLLVGDGYKACRLFGRYHRHRIGRRQLKIAAISR